MSATMRATCIWLFDVSAPAGRSLTTECGQSGRMDAPTWDLMAVTENDSATCRFCERPIFAKRVTSLLSATNQRDANNDR